MRIFQKYFGELLGFILCLTLVCSGSDSFHSKTAKFNEAE